MLNAKKDNIELFNIFTGGEIMKKIDKKQNFTSKIFSQDIEKINPFFSKVKIYVLYEGFNRNGSYLSRNAIEKAIPTLYNIPIVGEYLVEEQNFGGHGAKVVKNEQGEFQMVLSTRPYGVVPESAKVYWETVDEENGTQRDYLVVDGAFLWTARYPELQTIHDEGHYNQSMEIEMINANYSLVEGQEVLDVKDFVFTAFCLLGIDKDSDMFGHVEPAFESSKVVAYSLDKESFTSQFNQMIEELKFTLQEGGTNMEDTQAQFVEGAQDELKKRLEDGSPVATTVVEETEGDTPETDVVEEVQEAVSQATEVPTEVTEGEPEPTTPETETPTENGTDAVTEGATTDGGEAGTFSISEDEFNTLKANFEALNTEITELREYKRSRELNDLKDKFSTQISEQEVNALFEVNKETSIEKLELEIYALIGKKNFSLDLDSKKQTNKVSVVSPKTDEAQHSPYGDIFKNL